METCLTLWKRLIKNFTGLKHTLGIQNFLKDIASNHLKEIGLIKEGCMPEVFGVWEVVSWCSKRFDASNRIIQVGDNIVSPINLIPLVFQKMLILPKPNKELKLHKLDNFITNCGGPKRLLTYLIDSLSRVKTNAFYFDTNFLKDPFMEFSWLFTRVTSQESTTCFPWYVMFVLYGTFRMNWNFDWDQIIPNDISHQL